MSIKACDLRFSGLWFDGLGYKGCRVLGFALVFRVSGSGDCAIGMIVAAIRMSVATKQMMPAMMVIVTLIATLIVTLMVTTVILMRWLISIVLRARIVAILMMMVMLVLLLLRIINEDVAVVGDSCGVHEDDRSRLWRRC